MKQAALYLVLAFKNPGPTLQQVSEPVDRAKAVKTVKGHWNMGRRARAVLITEAPAVVPEGTVIWPEKFRQVRQMLDARKQEKRGAA